MTTYIAIAWMARAFYFNNIDREIAMEIQEGRVAVELIRPYNYLGMKVMQGLGEEYSVLPSFPFQAWLSSRYYFRCKLQQIFKLGYISSYL